MASARLLDTSTSDESNNTSAVDNLQSMFPTVDQETIRSVLDHNQNAIEATVDYLVAITQGDTVRLLSSQNEELGGPPRYVELPPHELESVQPLVSQKTLPNAFSDTKVKKTSKYTNKRRLSFNKKKEEESLSFLHNHAFTGSSDEEEEDGRFSKSPNQPKPESVGEKLVRTLSFSKRKQAKADPFSIMPSLKHDLLESDGKSDDDDLLGLTRGYHQLDKVT